jgi:hypothetical protein
MTITHFVEHQWKSFIRNEKWRRNMFVKILFLFLLFYFIFSAFFLTFYFNHIVISKGPKAVDFFNAYLLWYLVIDLFARSNFQTLPVFQSLSYLQFNIKKKSIIRYLIGFSFLNIFNIIPWLYILPFALKVILPYYGLRTVLIYLLGFTLFLLNNNLCATWIGLLKRRNLLYLAIPVCLIISFYFLEEVTSYHISTTLGQYLLEGNILLLLTLIITIFGLIFLIYRMMMNGFYMDLTDDKNFIGRKVQFINTNIFSSFKDCGHFMALEVTLLWRNKRSRQILMMIPIFVLYLTFLMMSKANTLSNTIINALYLSLLSAVGSMYGQFIFGWESTYFDGLMSKKIDIFHYVKAKLYLLSCISILGFLPIFILFLIFENPHWSLLISFLIFSVGVNNFFILYFATYNDGRMDLNQSQFFNYQGVNGSQLLESLLVFLFPVCIYSIVYYFFGKLSGQIVISLLGLIFIFGQNWWLKKIIIPQFRLRKYRNMEGFRKLST